MRLGSLPEIIRLASIASVALPLLMYLVKARYASKPLHLIGSLTIVSASSDIIAYILSNQGTSTVILFNIYYAVLFFLLAWFYYEIFVVRGGRTTVIAGIAIYLLSFFLVTRYVQAFHEYQTFMWTITGMLMIFYSITYFLYLFSAQAITSNYGLLWINSGILFYFSFNLVLFLMSSYVLTKLAPEISALIWSFHNVNNVLKNVLLAFGISSFNKEVADQSYYSRS